MDGDQAEGEELMDQQVREMSQQEQMQEILRGGQEIDQEGEDLEEAEVDEEMAQRLQMINADAEQHQKPEDDMDMGEPEEAAGGMVSVDQLMAALEKALEDILGQEVEVSQDDDEMEMDMDMDMGHIRQAGDVGPGRRFVHMWGRVWEMGGDE